MEKILSVRGARENNLKNIDVEIPRDKLVVVTGVSGSGKSSLAFDTIYAEGQRRFLESMSSWAKRFVQQLKKPQVDFVSGLSPVVCIDQKTITKNPRSTVGTMTDILDYLRMLYASIGTPKCPVCEEPVEVWSLYRMMEHILSLPMGTEVEARVPVLKIYNEDYPYLLETIRASGYRNIRIDGKLQDIGNEIELDESQNYFIEVIADVFTVQKNIDKQIIASLEHANQIGAGLFSFHIISKITKNKRDEFYRACGCKQHFILSSEMHHGWFTFNDAAGACNTCSGLGTSMRVHTPLLVPDPSRSLRNGAFVKEALNCDKNTWGGRILESLASHYKFSLDTPFAKLKKSVVNILFYGTNGEKLPIVIPQGATQGQHHEGKEVSYRGIAIDIEHKYNWYRKYGEASNWSEEYYRKIMVEQPCPDCKGTRLKKQRCLVTIDNKNIYQIGEMPLEELHSFIQNIKTEDKHLQILQTIQREIIGRLDTLINIGLNYLNLNRRSATLSGGESQRIRLSSQIGSGLMGMLYVLDEPSIGLHAKDNAKMIKTLRHLRDIGNTVIVVEHDEDTIRAADYIVEVGPGPGVHGGEIVMSGTVSKMIKDNNSITGLFLSGKKQISYPKKRNKGNGKHLEIKGAQHNNLDNLDIKIPLGNFTCITGASGSGKSSLIHETLYKKLYSLKYDSRVLSGKHTKFSGHEHVDSVIHIDQSPIGRTSRSNPATYIGFYDNIRKLFASTDTAKEKGYSASQFSFNVKGGRCEECKGEGMITTKLAFMPDVETTCPNCKGKRYNEDTLSVTYKDKNIFDVLEMSIEKGVAFFEDNKLIAKKLSVLNDLGLGYLTIGHPATILSGGEAQRVKLAAELAKSKRGKHNLYIFDEPTTGLHFADIQKLLDCLRGFVDKGHSVIVIEHNLDVIKTADYIIDLGPEGGENGGRIMAKGTPEQIAKQKKSHTGQFLAKLLK
ncbi:excinuclease ABC subunit UvrA [Candidatus Uabimicrobium sp. HlEnr_7]|uniref:excinuclease ABC subunit UvrA n=1 Tax=Candidatus Uabimicrobium helgolandensis TaxID=3095367 RepID=UPI0035571F5D